MQFETFKIQRAISEERKPFLVYNEDRSIVFEIPWTEKIYMLFFKEDKYDSDKIYVDGCRGESGQFYLSHLSLTEHDW